MKNTVWLAVLLLFIPISYAADCGGSIQCQCGDTLTQSQTMWYDIEGCVDRGVTIGTNNVTLDCNNHKISKIDGSTTWGDGIYLFLINGATISNCQIANFSRGIYLYASEDNVLTNNVMTNDYPAYGMRLEYSNRGNYIINNRFIRRGLSFDHSGNNYIWNNTFIECQAGVEFWSLNNNWNNSLFGNYWSFFPNNPGYPDHYEIPCSPNCAGREIDHNPIWDFDNDGWFNYQDCNDSNPGIHPSQPENCTTIYDDNCDGSIVDGCMFDFACYMYDDFSGDVLDERWREHLASIDEHYLDNNSGTYHTAQLTESDREVTLELEDYRFEPGEWAEFDLLYNSGEGNRICIVDIDESTRWWGVVGYWNVNQQGGNEFGRYHFNVTFTSYGADVYVTRPDLTTLLMYDFPQSPGLNHTFGFGTRTGHNGIVHMDYDNARICKYDADQDGIFYVIDNCPSSHNPDQTDQDSDGYGYACDCNDNNREVNPGHPEWCGTSYDDDCDGFINEGCSPHGGSPIYRKIIQPASMMN